MRTLFAAFGGATNSSKVLLDRIDCPVEDKLYLKNSFTAAPKQLRDHLASDNYDLIILFGQRKILRDPKTAKTNHPSNAGQKSAKTMPLAAICLETVGRNNRVAYHTEVNFPILAERLAKTGLDPIISKDAGRYLCNNLYFQAMKHLDENQLKAKVIFIHIPKLRQKPDLDKIAASLAANLDKKLLVNPEL